MGSNRKDLACTGKGVYTVGEAARLVKAHPSGVRRWLRGYRFPIKSGQGASPPVFEPDLSPLNGQWAVSFLDLVELLFIKSFRKEGVSWRTIRLAAQNAAQRWHTSHPFCLKRFATDGRMIFETAGEELGEDQVLELTRSQYGFKQVLMPYLKEFDYGELGVERWWPLGKREPLFLDPHISFGHPVVRPHNVPTSALYAALLAEQTEAEVAQWFDLPVGVVRAAVRFETSRAA